jgi:hypothetical protein
MRPDTPEHSERETIVTSLARRMAREWVNNLVEPKRQHFLELGVSMLTQAGHFGMTARVEQLVNDHFDGVAEQLVEAHYGRFVATAEKVFNSVPSETTVSAAESSGRLAGKREGSRKRAKRSKQAAAEQRDPFGEQELVPYPPKWWSFRLLSMRAA